MELEEMKKMWQQYDKVLQENKVLNEHIINGMLHDKSGNAIRRMLNLEYLSLAVVVPVLLVFLVMFNRLGHDEVLTGCYLFSFAYLVLSVVLGVYKVRFLMATEPGNQGVTEMANRIEKFRLLIAKERLLGIISLPFVMLAVYAVINYWVHGENIFNRFDAYFPRIIIGIVAATAIALAVYSIVYFRSIRQIKNALLEIKKFRNEA